MNLFVYVQFILNIRMVKTCAMLSWTITDDMSVPSPYDLPVELIVIDCTLLICMSKCTI